MNGALGMIAYVAIRALVRAWRESPPLWAVRAEDEHGPEVQALERHARAKYSAQAGRPRETIRVTGPKYDEYPARRARAYGARLVRYGVIK